MEGTYPLFVYTPARTMSRLGAICLPLEEQLEKPEAAQSARNQEVRAHSAQGPLFVKFRQARWLRSDASRRQHREAAWDLARAALKADIGRTFGAGEPGMIDHAWAFSGMPRRGQPITLRQVIRLARIADYLYNSPRPGACDGDPAEHARTRWYLAATLGDYRMHADREVTFGLPSDAQHEAPTMTHTVVHMCADPSGRGLAMHPDRDQASQAASPARDVPATPLATCTDRRASPPVTPCMHHTYGYSHHMASMPGVASTHRTAATHRMPATPGIAFTPAGPSEAGLASPSRSQAAGSAPLGLATPQTPPTPGLPAEADFLTPTRAARHQD